MTRFKQVREAARNLAVRATGDDGEEAKLNDLPSDQSQQDDADENNRNPDGTAEDQVEKSIKPIYTKTENGVYTLNTESVDEKKAERLAKIARAAAAREKDQADQKEKAKEKHYAASAKSREAVKHFGDKDQFGRPKNEEVEQVDEVSAADKLKAHMKAGEKYRRKDGDRRKGPNFRPMSDKEKDERIAHTKREIQLRKQVERERERAKQRNEEVEQTDESLRPASHSGIKDKFVHKEGLEQKLAKIRESKDAVEIEITENTIDDIKKLTTLSQAGTVRFADGSSAKVSPQSATALLQTHGNLNTNNQKKFAKKLASSASEFAKLEKFALQQARLTGRLYALNDL